MNASLVLLLLLPLVSTCHGKEQDAFPPSGILPTNNRQKQVEMALQISCPDSYDIQPCDCRNNGTHLTMDCSNVWDEELLRQVFSAFFPTTEFYEFKMWNNSGVKVLEDGVFGNVNFQHLDIQDSVLETVKISALTSSLYTLTEILIVLCDLVTFPFERLTEFTSLEYLEISLNKINTLPPLSSSSLRGVDLNNNLITHITPDVFTLLPAAERISLVGNDLTEVLEGTFTSLLKLKVLELDYNRIDYIEVDAFKGMVGSATISLLGNTLTRLYEEVWRPVLEKSITVNLAGNALACGCDVAWLVRDSHLLARVSDACCVDGTLLIDLNPTNFDICG